MYTILIVEDDLRMNEIIFDYLDNEQFKVYQAYNGEEAMTLFEEHAIDLVVLDIMLPKLDGWSVCRRIRKKSTALIVILSARSDEDDKLLGFELGADEYVTKPFSPKVLVARLKALLNRNQQQHANNNTLGILFVDAERFLVRVNDTEINLTHKEFEVLLKLSGHPSKVFSRESLIKSIWGYDYYGDTRIVDTNIKTLRRKLGEASKYIHTIINVGYKFEVKS